MHDSPRAGDGASMAVIELVELSVGLQEKDRSKQQEAAGKDAQARFGKSRSRPVSAEPKAGKSALAVAPPKTAAPVSSSSAAPSEKSETAPPVRPDPSKAPESSEEKKKPGLVEGLRKFLKGRGKTH